MPRDQSGTSIYFYEQIKDIITEKNEEDGLEEYQDLIAFINKEIVRVKKKQSSNNNRISRRRKEVSNIIKDDIYNILKTTPMTIEQITQLLNFRRTGNLKEFTTHSIIPRLAELVREGKVLSTCKRINKKDKMFYWKQEDNQIDSDLYFN